MDRVQRILDLCDEREEISEALDRAERDNDGEAIVALMHGLAAVSRDLRVQMCDG